MQILLSLPTTVPIAKAIPLRTGFTRFSDNCKTLVGNRLMALSV